MESSQFDPSGFYEFDAASGAIKARGGQRVLVLSDALLAPLVAAAASSGDLTPLRTLGNGLGEHAKESLGGDAAGGTPEAVFSAASAVMSVFGWGRLEVERWGDALALRVESLPALDERRLAAAALLGGLLSSLSGEEAACVPVGEQFLVVHPEAADSVWKLARSGGSVASIAASLQGGSR
ncbi:MAG: hypothetical protein AB8H86_13555 [Polyangiales bacterium]